MRGVRYPGQIIAEWQKRHAHRQQVNEGRSQPNQKQAHAEYENVSETSSHITSVHIYSGIYS